MTIRDRRKDTRMGLRLPVRVQGYDPDGIPWEEMTASEDTSFGGASFQLKHQVVTGQAVLLSLPLPKDFRRHDLTEPSYRTYALVRNIKKGPTPRVGVLFLGKDAPKGFELKPGGRYLLPSDPAPSGMREGERMDVFVNLTLLRIDSTGKPVEQEVTVTENLGKRGARVRTSMVVNRGQIVIVEELGGSFRTRAEVRNIYIGHDKIIRLNLHFLDAEAPDHLIPAG